VSGGCKCHSLPAELSYPNSVPPNPLAGFEVPLCTGEKRGNGEGREEKGKRVGREGWEKNTPRNKLLVTLLTPVI